MEIKTETDRLILREIIEADDLALFELDSNPEVCIYLGNNPVKNLEESQEIIKFIQIQYAENGIGRWAVILKETNEFIGWCGLKLYKEALNHHINFYELGYRFMPKYWGKGFATEAAKASLNYGFNKLKQEKIFAITDINNLKSIHVLEKIGFKIKEKFMYDNEEHFWLECQKESNTF